MESQPSKARSGTVLVTGGAIRLGAAISEALAEAGWNVVVHANQSQREAEALCQRLRSRGVKAWQVAGDLSLPNAGKTVMAEALKLSGHLDALVNNAALFSLNSKMCESERERMLSVNFHEPVQLTHTLYDHLCARKARGSVVNMLDQRIAKLMLEHVQRFTVTRLTCHIGERAPEAVRMSSELKEPTQYEESKMLLAQATLSDALALAPVLRINAVAPGAVLSPPRAGEKEPAGHFPLVARPTVGQVAEAVRWLLEAESVTGQTLYVDGGQHLLPGVIHSI